MIPPTRALECLGETPLVELVLVGYYTTVRSLNIQIPLREGMTDPFRMWVGRSSTSNRNQDDAGSVVLVATPLLQVQQRSLQARLQ